MEVLKLCVVQGVQACNLGVPILAEELGGAPRACADPHRMNLAGLCPAERVRAA